MGVNPKTGEKIKARKMVKFVPGKHSKKSCNPPIERRIGKRGCGGQGAFANTG
jgi:hypothetical protein